MIVTKGNVLGAKMERPVFIWLQKVKGAFWVNSSSHGNFLSIGKDGEGAGPLRKVNTGSRVLEWGNRAVVKYPNLS